MPIVRIVAVSKEGGHTYKNYRIVLVCHINQNNRISEGEWFGLHNESVSYRSYSKVEI